MSAIPPMPDPWASPQLWCAACGTWGAHTSGTCPTIHHPESVDGKVRIVLESQIAKLATRLGDATERAVKAEATAKNQQETLADYAKQVAALKARNLADMADSEELPIVRARLAASEKARLAAVEAMGPLVEAYEALRQKRIAGTDAVAAWDAVKLLPLLEGAKQALAAQPKEGT